MPKQMIRMEPLRGAGLDQTGSLTRGISMPSRHDPSAPRTPEIEISIVSPLSKRRAALRRELVHAGIWLLGLAGFLIPLILARTSPHADLLRGLALGWFLLFGAINGVFVLRTRPRPRGKGDL